MSSPAPEKFVRTWIGNFYYTFLSKREGIVVNDLSENKGYLLRFQPTAKRPVIQSAMPLDDAEPMQ